MTTPHNLALSVAHKHTGSIGELMKHCIWVQLILDAERESGNVS